MRIKERINVKNFKHQQINDKIISLWPISILICFFKQIKYKRIPLLISGFFFCIYVEIILSLEKGLLNNYVYIAKNITIFKHYIMCNKLVFLRAWDFLVNIAFFTENNKFYWDRYFIEMNWTYTTKPFQLNINIITQLLPAEIFNFFMCFSTILFLCLFIFILCRYSTISFIIPTESMKIIDYLANYFR